MNAKRFVMIGMVVGSFIGGYLPSLFGVDPFSFLSILLGGVGGILGIWVAFKLIS